MMGFTTYVCAGARFLKMESTDSFNPEGMAGGRQCDEEVMVFMVMHRRMRSLDY